MMKAVAGMGCAAQLRLLNLACRIAGLLIPVLTVMGGITQMPRGLSEGMKTGNIILRQTIALIPGLWLSITVQEIKFVMWL